MKKQEGVARGQHDGLTSQLGTCQSAVIMNYNWFVVVVFLVVCLFSLFDVVFVLFAGVRHLVDRFSR